MGVMELEGRGGGGIELGGASLAAISIKNDADGLLYAGPKPHHRPNRPRTAFHRDVHHHLHLLSLHSSYPNP